MNWSTLLSTLVGAVIGVGSTVILDVSRWHREGSQRWALSRRASYIDFLTALSAAHSGLVSAVLRIHADDGDAYGKLHEAVHGSQIWQRRQSLALTAPQNVLVQAVQATSCLELLRDILIIQPDIESDAYTVARNALWSANATLREVMRQDLGMTGPPDPDVDRFGVKV